jgi:hypothetical protein
MQRIGRIGRATGFIRDTFALLAAFGIHARAA